MSGATRPAIRLPRSVAEAIVEHARDGLPNEACGLVVGSALAADGGVARRYVPCRNAAASPSRYLVHRDDLLGVLAELDRTGEELWGVVHSHVRTPAVPSSTDVGEAAWPAAVYVLVSLAGEAGADGVGADEAGADDLARGASPSSPSPDLRAWRILDGIAGELAMEIHDDVPEDAP